jgi:hypothetical protein
MKKIIISLSVFILISSCIAHTPTNAGEVKDKLVKIEITRDQLQSAGDVAAYINRQIDLAADNAEITLPDGLWNLTGTISITGKDIILEGSGSMATHLRFYGKGPGIVIARTINMSRTTIRNLKMTNEVQDNEWNGTNDGIYVGAVVSLENLHMEGWYGDGIHFEATVGITPAADASHSYVRTVKSGYNRGDGIFITGGDANVINFYNVDVRDNFGWGINDSSFLGNEYFGCMAHLNRKGDYTSMNYNNRSSYYGCYSETGYALSRLGGEASVYGGLWSGGVILEHNATAEWNGQFFKAPYTPPAEDNKAPYHEDRVVSYREVQQMIQQAIQNKN